MERLCQIDNHNKPFTLVCTNPKCKSSRLFCFKCLESSHSKCLNFVLEISDLEKRTLSSCLNWVRSDEVKKAATTIEKHGLNTFEENFYKAFEELADQEFGKVTEFFIAKIQEAKKRVLEDVHNRLAGQKTYLKDFDDKLKGLYNFDAILGLLDQFQSGENDMERTSHDLQMFLEETSSKESQNRELHTIAKRINSFNEWFKELDSEKFEMFKQCIPFQIFASNNKPNNEPKQLVSTNNWTWDARNVSDEILLSTDHLMAKKNSYYSRTKQPVFGSIIMANGHFQWELDFTESAAHQPCFVNMAGCRTIFGIIDRELLDDLDDVPLDNIIGLTLGGKPLNMQEVHKLDSYKKKKFTLDLNLHKGTFCISENGLALCVESFKMKERSLVPIVVFFCVHDKVFLKVLHSIVELKKETENDMNVKMMKSSFL